MRPDPEKVAAYARVCGFTLRDDLPPTYPHVLAFPLHMAVMADGGFPFGAVGLVHIANRIVQHRRIGTGEELTIRVRPTKLEPHPKGRTFSLVTGASVDGETVWESTSTMLRRGPEKPADGTKSSDMAGISSRQQRDEWTPVASGSWVGIWGAATVPCPATATRFICTRLVPRRLAFRGRSRTGCGAKARCLAALESTLPDAFGVTVRFRKPILLPARVEFASATDDGGTDFAVRDPKRDTPHLDGRIEPLEGQAKNERK